MASMNSEIGDVAGAHLAIDHFLARGRKTGHWRTLRSRAGEARGKELETASSLVQTSPKRNADCAGEACDPLPSRTASGSQMRVYSIVTASRPISLATSSRSRGIVLLDGLREPDQAFVVAHRGDVARNDRGHRPCEIGLDVWHRITSVAKPGSIERSSGNTSFWRPAGRRSAAPDAPARRRPADSASAVRGNKSLRRRQFPCPLDAAPERDISSFASRNGFVIRCRVRTRFSPYSSVAQR